MTILGHQIDQVRLLLRAIIGDNAFCTRKLEEAGASYTVRNLQEFAESVPFTTRAELLQDRRVHPPFGSNLTYPAPRYRRCHWSSDPAGRALCWLDTAESWEMMVGMAAGAFQAAGVEEGDRFYFATTFGVSPGPWLAYEAATRSGHLCCLGTGLTSEARLAALLEASPAVVFGALGDLLELVNTAQAAQPDLSQSPVRLFLACDGTGRHAPTVREGLARLWPSARLHVQYVTAEAGLFAIECPARPDVLHLMEPSCVGEVVDPASGLTVERGQTGELVLTTLFRPGSPLLRYRTGHLARASVENICECGRQTTALEGGLLGQVGAEAA
jgi:phenylacetate-CoA ligase